MTVPGDRGGAPTLQLDGAGIVRLTWAAGILITGELARAALDLVDEASAGRERPLLVDLTGTPGMSREARVAFSRRCSASRIAVLGTSPVHRVITNFLEEVTFVPVPIRYFTSESAAVAWLSG